jgi:medium-chain acyl-[acyl-carrier-protein] hydrolase
MTAPASAATDRWIERVSSRAAPRFRLFCFPYAGGGAAIFRDWADGLDLNVEVCAIRLPGRERRYSEPALRRSEQVVESVIPILHDLLDMPFVMLGYSMGAILAYEVARSMLATAAIEPRALFVSAHRAPHSPLRRRNWHDLPRDELIAKLKALNGTPAEVFQHDDLMELMLPTLRGDLELVETYESPVGATLSCPIIAMGGSDDPDISPEDLAGWASVTAGPFKSMLVPGDHFFINNERRSFLQAIRRELGLLGLR